MGMPLMSFWMRKPDEEGFNANLFPHSMLQPAFKFVDPLLRHGRDVHPAWVNVVTAALALKSFGGQVTRAEIMLR
jgi:hypothetical protein